MPEIPDSRLRGNDKILASSYNLELLSFVKLAGLNCDGCKRVQVITMAVYCTNCGEELMGAVNRCWKCGHEFAAHSGDASLPPIRRRPLGDSMLVAQLADDDDSGTDAASNAPSEGIATTTIRCGSPFADRGTASIERMAASVEEAVAAPPIRPPTYPRFGGASAGAALTLPIGLIALLIAFLFPIGGLILSFAGLTLGIWGLYSRHRAVALAGLLLCCLSLAVAGFNESVEVYEQITGVKPWETADPLSGP